MADSNKEKVMRKLGRRSYSSYELRLKMKDEIPDIEEILGEFIQKGYINDDEWAKSYVRAEQSKGRGPMAISQKLRMKGYPREEIEKAMNGEDTGDALDLAIAKKSRKFTERHKIINALLRLGFHWDDIRARMGESEREESE